MPGFDRPIKARTKRPHPGVLHSTVQYLKHRSSLIFSFRLVSCPTSDTAPGRSIHRPRSRRAFAGSQPRQRTTCQAGWDWEKKAHGRASNAEPATHHRRYWSAPTEDKGLRHPQRQRPARRRSNALFPFSDFLTLEPSSGRCSPQNK
jgi:hypothetical protein